MVSVDPLGADLRPGSRVGEYEVQRLLGRGGMGAVYLAIQPQIGKRVAIKVLAQMQNAEMTARFLREAQVVNRIGHPGLVDIFSFGQLPSGQHFLVMELLSGESLAARLARGTMGWAELRDVFLQMLSALQAAHEAGVVHRDLKPDNAFLIGAAERRLKLLDFGLAKILDGSADMTHTGIALGTPRYMAPEQSRGGRHVDQRVDLYAVGLMMYEAITGRFPFEAPTPILMLTVKLSQDPPPLSEHAILPQRLEELVLRALHKFPDERFQTAREMADAIEALGPADAPIELRRRGAPAQATVAMQPVEDPSGGLSFEGDETTVSPQELQGRGEGGAAPKLLAADPTRLQSDSDVRQLEPAPQQEAPPRRQEPAAIFSAEETRVTARTGRAVHRQGDRRPRYGVWLVAGAAMLGGILCAVVLRGMQQKPAPPREPAGAAAEHKEPRKEPPREAPALPSPAPQAPPAQQVAPAPVEPAVQPPVQPPGPPPPRAEPIKQRPRPKRAPRMQPAPF